MENYYGISEDQMKTDYKIRFDILRCAHPNITIPDEELTIPEYEVRYRELVDEITRSENQRKHQELKQYIDALWPVIDEKFTFKNMGTDSLYSNKTLPELKAITKRELKTWLETLSTAVPEYSLVILFMDINSMVDLCYNFTQHMFDKMIAH